ncbi:MAG: hypothetical protein ACRDTH_14650, partial [Pseudonocardiaceae bacterium]
QGGRVGMTQPVLDGGATDRNAPTAVPARSSIDRIVSTVYEVRHRVLREELNQMVATCGSQWIDWNSCGGTRSAPSAVIRDSLPADVENLSGYII